MPGQCRGAVLGGRPAPNRGTAAKAPLDAWTGGGGALACSACHAEADPATAGQQLASSVGVQLQCGMGKARVVNLALRLWLEHWSARVPMQGLAMPVLPSAQPDDRSDRRLPPWLLGVRNIKQAAIRDARVSTRRCKRVPRPPARRTIDGCQLSPPCHVAKKACYVRMM